MANRTHYAYEVVCPTCGATVNERCRNLNHPEREADGIHSARIYCANALARGSARATGWWGMACWNGLSDEQQRRLIEHGNLPINYRPQGQCPNGAEVAIETEDDTAPGPRFYCRACAVAHLEHMNERNTR